MKKQLRFLQSGMGCTERIQATYSALSGASKKIADFVIDHPDQAVHMTVVQLAESCEVSEASVVRFCQCLQYAGFYEFKLSLAAEIVPASQMIQEDITVEDTEPTILEKVFAGEQQALQETLQMLNRQDFISAVNHIAFSNKVEFFSCGNARPIAQDAHYRLLRTGIDPRHHAENRRRSHWDFAFRKHQKYHQDAGGGQEKRRHNHLHHRYGESAHYPGVGYLYGFSFQGDDVPQYGYGFPHRPDGDYRRLGGRGILQTV